MSISNIDLKPCPFCGCRVSLEKRPLWGGGRGYYGAYKFIIECPNIDCGCQINLRQNDTIYRDEETAKQNVIAAWNRRHDNRE